jgi:hypothetical protein
MSSSVADTPMRHLARCVSCGAPLSGPYCSRCGERELEPDALTLRHFFTHTVAHELLHVDGTLWRTLRLLFVRPGQLSLEYAAGRRRPYVNPFRLLLIAIVAYTVMTASGLLVTWNLGPVTMSIAPAAPRRALSVEDTINQIDRYGLLRRQFEAKRNQLATETARERFHNRLEAFAEPVSFANVVLLAWALQLCFRSRHHRFLEHVAFAMHVISFVLLSSVTMVIVLRLRFWLGSYVYLAIVLFGFWQFVYLCLAIRRFYLSSGGWAARLLSVAAAILIYVLNTAFMTGVQVAGGAIALALS